MLILIFYLDQILHDLDQNLLQGWAKEMALSWEKVSARLQPATAGHARLVLSKTVPFFCTNLYMKRSRSMQWSWSLISILQDLLDWSWSLERSQVVILINRKVIIPTSPVSLFLFSILAVKYFPLFARTVASFLPFTHFVSEAWFPFPLYLWPWFIYQWVRVVFASPLMDGWSNFLFRNFPLK